MPVELLPPCILHYSCEQVVQCTTFVLYVCTAVDQCATRNKYRSSVSTIWTDDCKSIISLTKFKMTTIVNLNFICCRKGASQIVRSRVCLFRRRVFVFISCKAAFAVLHCVSKKDTTQPPTTISTIVVRFQYFLAEVLPRKICHRKVVWYTTSSAYYMHLTLGNFRTPKITSSAVKESLFEVLVFYLSVTFVSHTRSQCSKCCPSACMHALSCFLHSLHGHVNNVLLQTVPDVNEAQLQLIDTVHTTFIHSLLHNTPDVIIH